jgi:hypothetical protein
MAVTTAWPHVVNWLYVNFPAMTGLPASAVFDGHPVTGDSPQSFATVGYSTASDVPGQFTQIDSPDGAGIDEAGHVVCDLVVNSGDDGVAGARVAAFVMFDQIRAAVKGNRTLDGVLSENGTVQVMCDPLYALNAQGVATGLVLTVAYTTIDWPS